MKIVYTLTKEQAVERHHGGMTARFTKDQYMLGA
jgi:hypothetical protein